MSAGHGLHRGIGAHVPIGVLTRRLRADDADRRAFRIGAEHAERADGHPDVDVAGDHRLHRLPGTLGIENVEVEPMLLENAGARAERGRRAVPDFALADCDGELIGGRCRRNGDPRHECEHRCRADRASHRVPLLRKAAFVQGAGGMIETIGRILSCARNPCAKSPGQALA
jgi:hypothetical protein